MLGSNDRDANSLNSDVSLKAEQLLLGGSGSGTSEAFPGTELLLLGRGTSEAFSSTELLLLGRGASDAFSGTELLLLKRGVCSST